MTRYTDAVLSDGPVAYFPLDEAGTTVLDRTGHGYQGTCDANISAGSQPFAGSGPSKYIFAPRPPGLLFFEFFDVPRITLTGTDPGWPLGSLPHHTGALTIEAWLRIVPAAEPLLTRAFTVYAIEGAPMSGPFHVRTIAMGNGTFARLELRGAGYQALSDAFPILGQAWHHLAVTWDGAASRWYIDCSPMDPVFNAIGSPSGIIPVDAYLSGARVHDDSTIELAHVALYGYALTDEQLAAHCAAARPQRIRLTHADGSDTLRYSVPSEKRGRLTHAE
jgi:hypothetical protein